ncbi:glutamate racemase [Campylobacter pinnipediorum]|uniref:Glutamate racemase n=1 Tax=Campylobacter pinnipediorum subsp. pinnipediorum TaxID=1660067 RepID=A0AAX0LAR1_9BACT|nr:glutamate racemase [Campylobacter pinnipediorum]AQW82700.1 glutamate racemase [Campylobacter pinnipediorum subsp. pinnipediorum]AQW84387.1 glutamate racemase [Campylobacter pinnipediorum subsp. pinnipediorum]OPA78976.1 glutamate racemase [Campylobacter pinnipediorum subsp. pinnipediorum]
MKIGFFDSGFGGLSVLNEAMVRFDGYEFFYFADGKNVPYGTKSVEQITDLSINACEFLVDLGVDAIVVACNTATSASILALRDKFSLPIIGMEPAVKLALNTFKNQKTLLIATPATINGTKLKRLIDKLNASDFVDTLALPKLVNFAENEEFTTDNVRLYLEKSFKNLNLNDYSSLVLGCTHFNYFKDILKDILPDNVKFIDGINGTLNMVSNLNLASVPNNTVRYFYSKEEIQNLDKINRLLNRLDFVKSIV